MKQLTHRVSTVFIVGVFTLGICFALVDAAQSQTKSRTTTQRRQVTIRSAYERGYAAGYSDGYTSGKSDYNLRADRDPKRSTLYQEANRGFESRFGSLEDYAEVYRLGYEIAYTDGYYGRTSNAKIPSHAVTMRGTAIQPAAVAAAQPVVRPRPEKAILIPDNTQMRLRLETQLNTKTNLEGDRFTATVVEPGEYEGATVQGHIAKLTRSGKMTGRTELSLDFDTITLRNGRTEVYHAQIEKVFATESVKSVDEEGNIEAASKTKDTEIRTIGGAALGAIIGAIAGSGKGAAIGAIIGAGAGAGSVYVQGNKDLILEPGVQMLVRTSAPQSASRK
jgi:uncharacterized protein YcfJ